ncbi:MAG: hypothetical protein JWL77_2026 [Chthonomonadaceae bacterium]|nr:hypothetical protein [Chthonomonadaceae bacterium]
MAYRTVPADKPTGHLDKANDYALEALKQIVTLASAILALTITFIKDILGDQRDQALLPFLVPVAWLLLGASIVWAWLGIAEASQALGRKQASTYVFDAPNPQTRAEWRQEMRAALFPPWGRSANASLRLAQAAQIYFITGLAILGLFALINFMKPPARPKVDDTQKQMITTLTAAIKALTAVKTPVLPPVQVTVQCGCPKSKNIKSHK